MLAYIVCMKNYYTYILANKRNETLYIGVTGDLARRMAEHEGRQNPGVHTEIRHQYAGLVSGVQHIEHALIAEKKLKKAIRRKKIELIEEVNPEWNDLADFSLPR